MLHFLYANLINTIGLKPLLKSNDSRKKKKNLIFTYFPYDYLMYVEQNESNEENLLKRKPENKILKNSFN